MSPEKGLIEAVRKKLQTEQAEKAEKDAKEEAKTRANQELSLDNLRGTKHPLGLRTAAQESINPEQIARQSSPTTPPKTQADGGSAVNALRAQFEPKLDSALPPIKTPGKAEAISQLFAARDKAKKIAQDAENEAKKAEVAATKRTAATKAEAERKKLEAKGTARTATAQTNIPRIGNDEFKARQAAIEKSLNLSALLPQKKRINVAHKSTTTTPNSDDDTTNPQFTYQSSAPQISSRPHDRSHFGALAKLHYEIAQNPNVLVHNYPPHIDKLDHMQELASQVRNDFNPLKDAEGFTPAGNNIWIAPQTIKGFTGPIFMSRFKDGNVVLGADNKPVYDILYYHEGSLQLEKSLIAPDGVPQGSVPSIDSKTRNKYVQLHSNRNVTPPLGPHNPQYKGYSR